MNSFDVNIDIYIFYIESINSGDTYLKYSPSQQMFYFYLFGQEIGYNENNKIWLSTMAGLVYYHKLYITQNTFKWTIDNKVYIYNENKNNHIRS